MINTQPPHPHPNPLTPPPGDLKAGNVMLTGSSDPTSGMTNSRVWASSGSRRLTAKVADFGLSLPLGPSDTHATLLARVGGRGGRGGRGWGGRGAYGVGWGGGYACMSAA